MGNSVRNATIDDREAIVGLVNAAYEVERFFVLGDRTSADEIRRLMAEGTFLVGMDDDRIVASIYIDVRGAVASFGLLAVRGDARGRGWGRRLIGLAESRARAAGATTMEIQVVDLRADLFPFYQQLGYSPTGTAPYVHRPVVQPCHFVVLQKGIGVRS